MYKKTLLLLLLLLLFWRSRCRGRRGFEGPYFALKNVGYIDFVTKEHERILGIP